jgi:hypothetical protein
MAAYPGLAADKYMHTPESHAAVLAWMADKRATAVLRTPSKETAGKAMAAAVEGGFKLCEFTLTTPGCLDLVSDFRKKYDGKVQSRSRRRAPAARWHARVRAPSRATMRDGPALTLIRTRAAPLCMRRR